MSEELGIVIPDTARPEKYKEARLAVTADEVERAQELRFRVFVEEMGKGHRTESRRDEDDFDRVLKHLIVENAEGDIVGTYRLQTWADAKKYRGLYSAGEFIMDPFEPYASIILETGRACVRKEDRNLSVLRRLWRGIGQCMKTTGCKIVLGCSSLSTTDPGMAAKAYHWFKDNGHLARPEYLTVPHASGACRLDVLSEEKLDIPKLLRAYLGIGAKIGGPPFIDTDFGTTDFLTILHLDDIPPDIRAKYID